MFSILSSLPALTDWKALVDRDRADQQIGRVSEPEQQKRLRNAKRLRYGRCRDGKPYHHDNAAHEQSQFLEYIRHEDAAQDEIGAGVEPFIPIIGQQN